jgi:hypothetical protein
MPPNGTGKHDLLSTLATLLRSALDLTVDLARDSHLPRLLAVFAAFPPADRLPLLAKLESEVQARQRSLETGDGSVGQPNPASSLYIRIYENDRPVPLVTRDTMLRGTVQAMTVMHAAPETIRLEMEEGLLAGMAALDPADAAALARHHEDLLALAAWCEKATGEGEVPA